MDRNRMFVMSFLMLCLVIPSGFAADNPVLAKVGDMEIRQSDIDHKIEEIPVYARKKFETVEGQQNLLERLVRTKLLMQAAIDEGYADDAHVKMQIQEARERILSSMYFENHMSLGPMPGEKKMKKYYEDNKDELFKSDATVEARNIVVKDKETAEKVKGMLDKGKLSFEKAVEIYSVDETKENGGNLGVLKEDGFIRGIGRSRPFIEMIFNLQANEISEPFKSRKGYHLVQLIKKTNAGYQDYETVKTTIAKELLVSKEQIKKDYIDNQQNYLARARCEISHILLNTQEEAEKVYQELQSGKNFESLVEQYSVDQQSKKQKGSLGNLYKGGYIRGVGKDVEFENAVFAMDPGTVSQPIKSRKGWHLIRVEEKVEESVKPLIEVETEIRQKLIRENKDEFLETKFKNLEKKYNTVIFEDQIKAKK